MTQRRKKLFDNLIDKFSEKPNKENIEKKELRVVSDKVIGGELVYDPNNVEEDVYFNLRNSEPETNTLADEQSEVKLRKLSFKEERLFKRTGIRPK